MGTHAYSLYGAQTGRFDTSQFDIFDQNPHINPICVINFFQRFNSLNGRIKFIIDIIVRQSKKTPTTNDTYAYDTRGNYFYCKYIKIIQGVIHFSNKLNTFMLLALFNNQKPRYFILMFYRRDGFILFLFFNFHFGPSLGWYVINLGEMQWF